MSPQMPNGLQVWFIPLVSLLDRLNHPRLPHRSFTRRHRAGQTALHLGTLAEKVKTPGRCRGRSREDNREGTPCQCWTTGWTSWPPKNHILESTGFFLIPHVSSRIHSKYTSPKSLLPALRAAVVLEQNIPTVGNQSAMVPSPCDHRWRHPCSSLYLSGKSWLSSVNGIVTLGKNTSQTILFHFVRTWIAQLRFWLEVSFTANSTNPEPEFKQLPSGHAEATFRTNRPLLVKTVCPSST